MNFDKQIEEYGEVFHLLALKLHEPDKNDFKLNSQEINILLTVQNNENIIIKDLKEKINIQKSTLTSLINRLEEKEMISREINPHDKRSFILKLEENGEEVCRKQREREYNIFKDQLKKLDNYEKEELIKLMKKMTKEEDNGQ